MPDTLSTFSQAMALVPDNTSRLISPDDQRSVAISLLTDRGSVYGDPALGPWLIPIPAVDTWVDIPLSIAADMVQADVLFWRKDANGQLFYNYAADWPTIVVPPGMVRQVTLLAVVDIDPGNATWEFAWTIGGVLQAPVFTVDSSTSTDALTVTILSGDPIDVSLAPPVSLQVRNITSATDLPLNLVSLRATGGPLA